MTIVADENIDGLLVAGLLKAGHEVIWISHANPGIPDFEVLAESVLESALLITEDKDFGDLIFNHYMAADSVLLLRTVELSIPDRAARILEIIETSADELVGCFSVLTDAKLRIRPIHP